MAGIEIINALLNAMINVKDAHGAIADVIANRPLPADAVNDLFISTDTGMLFYSDGTQWIMLGGGTPGLATASNGLTAVGSDVQLGGSLIAASNTNVDIDDDSVIAISNTITGNGTFFTSNELVFNAISDNIINVPEFSFTVGPLDTSVAGTALVNGFKDSSGLGVALEIGLFSGDNLKFKGFFTTVTAINNPGIQVSDDFDLLGLIGKSDFSPNYTDLSYIQKIFADNNFQPLENQRLSTTDSVEFASVTADGDVVADADVVANGKIIDTFNIAMQTLAGLGNASGVAVIANNFSGGSTEVDFFSIIGSAPSAIGGFAFYKVSNDGLTFTLLGQFHGDTGNFDVSSRLVIGNIPITIANNNDFVQVDQVTPGLLVRRTNAEVIQDLLGTPAPAFLNTVTEKIPVVIGGVTYYLLASTSPL